MRCGIAVGAAALTLIAATTGAQDGRIGAEVFFGGGGFLLYADVLYGMPAARNRRFGFRVGARFVGYGLHLVAVLGFTAA